MKDEGQIMKDEPQDFLSRMIKLGKEKEFFPGEVLRFFKSASFP
jgi:hypothetical protein